MDSLLHPVLQRMRHSWPSCRDGSSTVCHAPTSIQAAHRAQAQTVKPQTHLTLAACAVQGAVCVAVVVLGRAVVTDPIHLHTSHGKPDVQLLLLGLPLWGACPPRPGTSPPHPPGLAFTCPGTGLHVHRTNMSVTLAHLELRHAPPPAREPALATPVRPLQLGRGWCCGPQACWEGPAAAGSQEAAGGAAGGGAGEGRRPHEVLKVPRPAPPHFASEHVLLRAEEIATLELYGCRWVGGCLVCISSFVCVSLVCVVLGRL